VCIVRHSSLVVDRSLAKSIPKLSKYISTYLLTLLGRRANENPH
jgi:hypothetical protein